MQSLTPASSRRMAKMPAHVTDPAKCWAHSKTTGKQCGNPPKAAQHVCRYHGANSPNALAAAERRIEAAKAEDFLKQSGYPPMTDPLEALMALAGEVWAGKEFFRSQIDTLRYSGQTGEQLRAEVALYERALDRCMKVLAEITRLGIAERLARIKEDQQVQVVALLQRVIEQLDLTPSQKVIAGTVIPTELRALDA